MPALPGSPVARAHGLARRLRHRGDAVECPICNGRFRGFLPYGGRQGVTCPGCGSAERHRLTWLYLRERTDLFSAPRRVLHFGPEPFLERRLRRLPNLDYLSTDIDATQAMVAADITDLPFPDDDFDVVICSHVLEHVDDDVQGAREIARVVRADGFALVLCPVEQGRPATFEDPAIVDSDDRDRAYGHPDHRRLYGEDLPVRLEEAGLDVETTRYLDSLEAGAVRRFGLRREDRFGPDELYRCTKRAGGRS